MTFFLASSMLVFGIFLINSNEKRASKVEDIAVTGTASVNVISDVAFINLAVVTESESVSEAISSNNKQMKSIFEALENNHVIKIEDSSVDAIGHFSTQRFQVAQRNRYDTQGNRVYSGWIVTNQIKVELEKTEKLASILSMLLEIEGSKNLNIHGVGYGIKNKEEALNEARKRAVLDATEKATLYTRAVGVTLGDIRSIAEMGVSIPNARNEGIQVFAADAGKAPVTGGQQTISVTVRASFSIEE